MKKCPYCAEEIQDEAVLCRYCGKEIAVAQPEPDIYAPNVQRVGGKWIDLHSVVLMQPKSKPLAVAYLANLAKVSRNEAHTLLTPIYEKFHDELRSVTFGQRLKAQFQIEVDQPEEERTRLAQYDRDGVPYCPKCHSTSLSANKKGFGIGKAVVGAGVFGALGLVAGNAGAQKVTVTCMKCGHQFQPGKK